MTHTKKGEIQLGTQRKQQSLGGGWIAVISFVLSFSIFFHIHKYLHNQKKKTLKTF
jgi:hypothetical protein